MSMTGPLQGAIMKTKILATLKGPEQRAAFEALLKEHGLANKMTLTHDELAKIGLNQALLAFDAGANLIDEIARAYREELPRLVAEEVKKDPGLAEQVAAWFVEAFKAAGPSK
jgi:hypothetical protein